MPGSWYDGVGSDRTRPSRECVGSGPIMRLAYDDQFRAYIQVEGCCSHDACNLVESTCAVHSSCHGSLGSLDRPATDVGVILNGESHTSHEPTHFTIAALGFESEILAIAFLRSRYNAASPRLRLAKAGRLGGVSCRERRFLSS
jgi:hypothetical protein